MKLIASAKPSLDVRDLELVLALAAAGSTVRAAGSLHLTQSAVSRGLLLAEEKLGARIFERTARGLKPTAAGERLVRGAAPLLAQLAELERDARAPAPKPTRVRLVCECYTAYRWLPSTLLQLHKRLSDLEVTIAFEHTRAPVRALERRDVDIALLTTAEVSKGLGEIPLFSDEIVFVVGRDHPLARRATITREDLTSTTWLTSTQTPEPEVSWFMTRVFGRKRPHVSTIRFPLTEAIVDAARANLGVAIMSEWIVMPYLGGGDLVVKRFRGRALRRPWRLAYRHGLEDSARHLAAVLGGASPRL